MIMCHITQSSTSAHSWFQWWSHTHHARQSGHASVVLLCWLKTNSSWSIRAWVMTNGDIAKQLNCWTRYICAEPKLLCTFQSSQTAEPWTGVLRDTWIYIYMWARELMCGQKCCSYLLDESCKVQIGYIRTICMAWFASLRGYCSLMA